MDIKKIIDIAKKAGEKILEIYDSEDFEVQIKVDPKGTESPLTKADLAAHHVIESGLQKLTPEVPILSEESKEISYETRKDWKEFWLVDPLDGTKEFIKSNGEFTVNIALIKEGRPVLGVVYVPVKDECYYADENGAFKDGTKITGKEPGDMLSVVASRSHFTDETKEYIESLGKPYNLVNAGSSLKLCLVAEGKADLYPRLGPTMEWDTAAAHAIVLGAGKRVLDFKTGKELVYNKEDLLNPWFVVK